MRAIDVQVGCLGLSSRQGMRQTLQRIATQTPHNLPGDGAELPLLRPELLSQFSIGTKERRTSNSVGDCLILSDDGLDKFDTERLAEVRAALSGEFRVDPFGWQDGPARRGTRLKRMVFGIVIGTLAVVVGLTIGWVF